jgi:ArsR family transcriptional regulator
MSSNPKIALLEEYALVARALAASARMMLLEQVAQGERGVEGLAEKTGLTFANASQHLQQLRRAGLVASRREGKSVHYRLTDTKTVALMEPLHLVAERNLGRVAEILRDLSAGTAPPEPLGRHELARRMAEGSVTIFDLRPADEYAMGHIPGARNLSVAELERIAPSLDQDTEVVAYCRGPYCIYAHQAVAVLRAQGLRAHRLDGGLPEWRADGRQVAASMG